MPAAPLPENEAARLETLYSYEVLDSACEAAFDDIARLAARLTGRPIALVSLTDANRQWFKARHGLEAEEAPRDHAFCAHAILHPDQPMVIPDLRLDARFADNPLVAATPHLRSYAGVPLVNPEGFALGTLCVIDHAPRPTTPDELEVLGGLARSVSTALELRRAMHRMRDMALTDGLTGLPNRSALMAALDAVIQRRQAFTLLFIDLDGFKRVNDRLGHAAGDAVLLLVAQVLRAALRRGEVAARLGGDEFCILLPDTAGAKAMGEQLRVALAERMGQSGFAVTASIGAMGFAVPPASAEAALAAADTLMYAAKAAGKDRLRWADHQAAAADQQAG
ncbi:sensor domain-containing diguanylate cyclase [Paeniroseomonas aquatica]|uniref:Sensor domain-containing diguanylate cyclase n=1 Tax=Paeniroseomonas aquatica TaxID=373043 RepID=A0ABT8A2F2_9PROT|nr:sensor domain-containing diguanylate cyclase [Paeniroseomonas aquatica]MDN3563806.1 sensor domain-containing diguanylate cyclase [Paeniroseomonas aquatica]